MYTQLDVESNQQSTIVGRCSKKLGQVRRRRHGVINYKPFVLRLYDEDGRAVATFKSRVWVKVAEGRALINEDSPPLL